MPRPRPGRHGRLGQGARRAPIASSIMRATSMRGSMPSGSGAASRSSCTTGAPRSGFHWARRHPERVRGLVYMEALVRPVTWEEWPDAARKIFQAMRSPAGEEMVLVKNVFVERILPRSVLRGLTDEEMAVYRRPYREPGESRRPTLTWPREIPIGGRASRRGGDRRRVRPLARAERHPQALRQRGPGDHSDRGAARVLPALAQSARGHRAGQPFHPGRFARPRSARPSRRS